VINHYFEQVVTVTDNEMTRAMVRLLDREKILVEGAGCVAATALLENRVPDISGKKVCAIISGGNVDLNFVTRIIEKGLAEDGKLICFEIVCDDSPGNLSAISTDLGKLQANIIDIFHTRGFGDLEFKETKIRFVCETKNRIHSKEISDFLAKNYNYSEIHV